jgi:uncharacterized protein YkwD
MSRFSAQIMLRKPQSQFKLSSAPAVLRHLCLIERKSSYKGRSNLQTDMGHSYAMTRRFFFLSTSLLALAACTTTAPRLGPDGLPLPTIYRINVNDTARIQFRVLDSINSLRNAAGSAPLVLNAELNAAAETHSRDMSVQNRPWHFGSDGSSPIDRAARVGYTGTVQGENISETYESELETVAAWMQQPDTRDVITDSSARDLGFAFFQEENGKIWWTLVTGDGGTVGPVNSPTFTTTTTSS